MNTQSEDLWKRKLLALWEGLGIAGTDAIDYLNPEELKEIGQDIVKDVRNNASKGFQNEFKET